MFKYLAFCMALLAGAPAANAALSINVGNHPLLPNTPNQKVPLYVTGDVRVVGVQVQCQIADGGPLAGGVITGPTITSLDVLTGTIFADNNNGQTPDLNGVLLPQLATRGTMTNNGTEIADGLLATVTIDTTGWTAIGQPWELRLASTVNGDTVFGETLVPVTNGTITLAAPEPGSAVFLAAAGAAWLLRRRAGC